MKLGPHDAAVVFKEDGSIHLLMPPSHPSPSLSYDQNVPTTRALCVGTLFDDRNPDANELRDRLHAALDFQELAGHDSTLH